MEIKLGSNCCLGTSSKYENCVLSSTRSRQYLNGKYAVCCYFIKTLEHYRCNLRSEIWLCIMEQLLASILFLIKFSTSISLFICENESFRPCLSWMGIHSSSRRMPNFSC